MPSSTRTQVGIIGAGPAGLTLSRMLGLQGVDSVVLERRSRAHLESRVRAGVLEHGTVQTLHEAGVDSRLRAQGMVHAGTELRFNRRRHRIDFVDLVGRDITVYGQQEVVKDLIAAQLQAGADIRFETEAVRLHDLDGERPRITFQHGGVEAEIVCDFVVGADGSHGASRSYLPDLAPLNRGYPFSWLGILAEATPSSHELIYARHANGFALHSMRSPEITRMYLQVPADERLDAWPDERIWQELSVRLSTEDAFALTEGPILQKSLTSMRSMVSPSMQYGRLYLAGDAAHIVPPTGAKGLNLAIADVRLLARAFAGFYAAGRTDLLASYTDAAQSRIWRATHFSWWMTSMLHTDPHDDTFGHLLAEAQLQYVVSSRAMATSLAENYTGLPFQEGWSYR